MEQELEAQALHASVQECIVELRVRRGMTLLAIAQAIPCSYETVARLADGHALTARFCTVAGLHRLAGRSLDAFVLGPGVLADEHAALTRLIDERLEHHAARSGARASLPPVVPPEMRAWLDGQFSAIAAAILASGAAGGLETGGDGRKYGTR